MIFLRKRGEKTKFSVIDAGCLGRECLVAGMYQHRGATMSGSRNTGSPDSPCCLTRAYRGCPDGPIGMRSEDCDRCKGTGKMEGDPCCVCGGHGHITIVGLPDPEVDKALAQERKREGWRAC